MDVVSVSISDRDRLKHVLNTHKQNKNCRLGLEATTVLCHRRTPREELKYFAKRADVLISATGIVNFVTPDLIKPGACVIDVGINRITTPDGKQKIVGDVDYEGESASLQRAFRFCYK